MAKFPSDFPLHKVFGQSMAGGVVPVIGGFVIALQATKTQAKAMIVFILFLCCFSSFLVVLLLCCGRSTVIFSFQTSFFIGILWHDHSVPFIVLHLCKLQINQ